jgi:DNA repair exonuclease SbcCD nuclease subunit
MKLLILGDLHLVSPADPNVSYHQKRAHFAEARNCLPAMARKIREESPDFILSLGDLVDWYSDENRDYALEFLNSLNIPWLMTPGNHDCSSPLDDRVSLGLAGWEAAGVVTDNQKLTLDHIEAYLVNSCNSGVLPGTADWLNEHMNPDSINALFTHVPPDTPEVRATILNREPHRNLIKYVQSRAPELFETALAGKVDSVWSGHLHFQATTSVGRTRFNILPLAIKAHGKTYPDQGTLHFLDTSTMQLVNSGY